LAAGTDADAGCLTGADGWSILCFGCSFGSGAGKDVWFSAAGFGSEAAGFGSEAAGFDSAATCFGWGLYRDSPGLGILKSDALTDSLGKTGDFLASVDGD